jgi:hypothetical protein
MTGSGRYPIPFKNNVRIEMDISRQEMAAQVEDWISAGCNPGIAHWHGALEATMASFKPHLQPGRLIPVQDLDKRAYAVFEELYAGLDFCPDTQAAFLPTALGGVLSPPAAVDNLRRVHPDNTSCMLLCRRPGSRPRILCAEISQEAWKPGVDLFEEGRLLGNYEFDSSADCIRELPKLIRTHLWRKGQWTTADHEDYTLNWFTRVADTGRSDAPVQSDFSYLHTPALANLGCVDAIFKLLYALVARQLQEAVDTPREPGKPGFDAGIDEASRHRFLEGRMLALLNLLRDSQAVDFTAFTSRENELFKDGFTVTVQRLNRVLKTLQIECRPES